MIVDEEEYLAHYGILRRSGRYPWGSSNNPSTRNKGFLDYVQDLRDKGLSEVEIARGLDVSTTHLRAAKSIAKNEQKQSNIRMAEKLKAKGTSNGAIAERMGLAGESSVRALLAPGVKEKTDILITVADMLKEQVAEKTYLDVGSGVEKHIGISENRLKTAVAMLREQGYEQHLVKVKQLGTEHQTEFKILAPPGSTQKEVWMNRDKIQQVVSFSDDGGRTNYGILTPKSIKPSRVAVKYGDEGGSEADGVILVRPGVKDVSLGGSRYAQVRIQVGDGHYLKGMAMYSNDLPEGVDLVFNTNKKDTGNKFDAMKEVSTDTDNPFGAVISRQIVEGDPGKEQLTSVMNIVNEEGDWTKWSKNLSSQVLSKQPPSLAKSQLTKRYDQKKKEFDEIQTLTNPTVKRTLLNKFADDADSSSVHLKAAVLSQKQQHHAILPLSKIAPTKVYAPNYENGTKVVLIRHPHGGTFEIPELIVDNSNREGKALLGDARDAIGIHHSVAERLSGADFDGDTVIVIPDNRGRITTTAALEGLKDFDPRSEYPGYEGMPTINTQQEMGNISNLITDMTIHAAPPEEIARAVRHSMVVIDAEKHNLNYRLSAADNTIAALKEKYQGGKRAGASTLISRASSEIRVPERKPRPASEGGPIDPKTGAKVFVPTNRTRTNREGSVELKPEKVKRLAETDDAHTLVSGTVGTPIERIYADHSNSFKAMANEARLAALHTSNIPYSKSARQVYAREVASLSASLELAIRNRPLERQAQVFANTVVQAKRQGNPDMDKVTRKKIESQALTEQRNRTGAQRHRIVITPREWDAIQAGAISNNRLSDILNYADLDVVKSLATPRHRPTVSAGMLSRARAMMASGATRAEVAAQLGIALGTLDEALYGG